MIKIKLIFLSSCLFMFGCYSKGDTPVIKLESRVENILSLYLNKNTAYRINPKEDYITIRGKYDFGKFKLRVSFRKYALGNKKIDFLGISNFKEYKVLFYGDINSEFYQIADNEFSNYKLIEEPKAIELLFDPPVWWFSFSKENVLLEVEPKEIEKDLLKKLK